MATMSTPRTVAQRIPTAAGSSSRSAAHGRLAAHPLPAVFRQLHASRPARRCAAVTQAHRAEYRGDCNGGRRGGYSRGAWEPQVWDLASGPFGYALKQFSREMAAAAAAAAANPSSFPGSFQQQQQQKGQPMGGDWAKMWTDMRQAIPVDLEEEGDKYTLTADVPGLQKSDLKITVNKSERSVTLSGERQRQQSGDDSEVQAGQHQPRRHYERRMGKFQRTIPAIPEEADLSSVTARVDKGVLTVSIRKSAPKQQEPEDTFTVNIA